MWLVWLSSSGCGVWPLPAWLCTQAPPSGRAPAGDVHMGPGSRPLARGLLGPNSALAGPGQASGPWPVLSPADECFREQTTCPGLYPRSVGSDPSQGESENLSVVSDSLQPHGLYSLWNSPGQNTGVGCPFLFQGIFPTQGSNPGLQHCRQILYQLSH